MPSIINQAGYAVTVLDFTPDTYSFPIGLVMLTVFSVALILVEGSAIITRGRPLLESIRYLQRSSIGKPRKKSQISLGQAWDKFWTCSDMP